MLCPVGAASICCCKRLCPVSMPCCFPCSTMAYSNRKSNSTEEAGNYTISPTELASLRFCTNASGQVINLARKRGVTGKVRSCSHIPCCSTQCSAGVGAALVGARAVVLFSPLCCIHMCCVHTLVYAQGAAVNARQPFGYAVEPAFVWHWLPSLLLQVLCLIADCRYTKQYMTACPSPSGSSDINLRQRSKLN